MNHINRINRTNHINNINFVNHINHVSTGIKLYLPYWPSTVSTVSTRYNLPYCTMRSIASTILTISTGINRWLISMCLIGSSDLVHPTLSVCHVHCAVHHWVYHWVSHGYPAKTNEPTELSSWRYRSEMKSFDWQLYRLFASFTAPSAYVEESFCEALSLWGSLSLSLREAQRPHINWGS